MIRTAGRAFFHIFNEFFGHDLIRWPGLFLPSAQLRGMSVDELKAAYDRDFALVVENSKSLFLRTPSYFAGVEAFERCLLYLDRMSELTGGPHGRDFVNSCRRQLKKQARQIAKKVHA